MSGAVNHYAGCNLKSLLNRYRIEYAKCLLRECKHSIREIPYLSGFSSRSVFYASFKKLVGTTPIHYLTTHNEKNQ
ncbi:MAG: helix-turn-helix domain-containing protein [Bacteroidaceae bacterium]|nr:helix-turn-helix domain-containing protein [Bacteroidaceae bacterium]